MGLNLIQFSHDDPKLWAILGPFACDRQVHKDLGGPIFSTETTTWWLAIEKERLVGFCSVGVRSNSRWLDYGYVIPTRRKKGIHTKLCEARDKWLKSQEQLPINVCCRKDRWPHYEKRGFSKTSVRGSWIYGRKG